jgi:hypothetical protein
MPHYLLVAEVVATESKDAQRDMLKLGGSHVAALTAFCSHARGAEKCLTQRSMFLRGERGIGCGLDSPGLGLGVSASASKEAAGPGTCWSLDGLSDRTAGVGGGGLFSRAGEPWGEWIVAWTRRVPVSAELRWLRPSAMWRLALNRRCFFDVRQSSMWRRVGIWPGSFGETFVLSLLFEGFFCLVVCA